MITLEKSIPNTYGNFFIYEIAGVNIATDGTVKDGNSNKVEEFLNSHYLEIALRSSLAVKGLIIPNGIGIIDLDYTDEIGLIVHNPIIDKNFNEEVGEFGSDRDAFVGSEYIINKGDKVAQCTLKEHKGYLMGYESDIIRNGGFGSTDKG